MGRQVYIYGKHAISSLSVIIVTTDVSIQIPTYTTYIFSRLLGYMFDDCVLDLSSIGFQL